MRWHRWFTRRPRCRRFIDLQVCDCARQESFVEYSCGGRTPQTAKEAKQCPEKGTTRLNDAPYSVISLTKHMMRVYTHLMNYFTSLQPFLIAGRIHRHSVDNIRINGFMSVRPQFYTQSSICSIVYRPHTIQTHIDPYHTYLIQSTDISSIDNVYRQSKSYGLIYNLVHVFV